MKRLLAPIAILMFVIGMFGGTQFLLIAPASAGAVPPPDQCNAADTYHYSQPDCWGNAGNPPNGCLNGDTVKSSPDCLAWKAKAPAPVAANTAACGSGMVTGPLGVCCAANDQVCLNGSIQTAQGDPASLALAKKICQDAIASGKLSNGILPAQCSIDQPPIAAAQQVCLSYSEQVAALGDYAAFDDDLTANTATCNHLIVISAGESQPNQLAAATDVTLAKEVCDLLRNDIKVKAETIPPGCNEVAPGPQDGVQACKLYTLDGLDSGKSIAPKCLDLMTRNPANSILDLPTAAIHVKFDDTNLKKLTSGLSYFILVCCVGGIAIAGLLWLRGQQSNNMRHVALGKNILIVSVVAALIVGALPSIFSFVDGRAHNPNVDRNGVTTNN